MKIIRWLFACTTTALAVAAPAGAHAGPTCTAGDLTTRTHYQCEAPPWQPVPGINRSPTHNPQCSWFPRDPSRPFDVTRTCRQPPG